MAAHQSEDPTDKVMFSQDEGACWHTIQLGEAIDVIGIKCAQITARTMHIRPCSIDMLLGSGAVRRWRCFLQPSLSSSVACPLQLPICSR